MSNVNANQINVECLLKVCHVIVIILWEQLESCSKNETVNLENL